MNQALNQALIESEVLVSELREKLSRYSKTLESEVNWGHVGDINHINQKLRDLLGKQIKRAN